MTKTKTTPRYKGFTMNVSSAGVTRVFDPRCPKSAEVYQASSLLDAKRWVTAYQRGEHWAVQAASRGPRPGGSAPAPLDSRSLLPPLGPYPGR